MEYLSGVAKMRIGYSLGTLLIWGFLPVILFSAETKEPSDVSKVNTPAAKPIDYAKFRPIPWTNDIPQPVKVAALGPTGQRIAIFDDEKNLLHVFDMKSGKDVFPPVKLIEEHPDLFFSPKGTLIFVPSGSKFMLLNGETGAQIAETFIHPGASSVTLSSDGTFILTVEGKPDHSRPDTFVRHLLWSAETGEVLKKWGTEDQPAPRVDFFPDGKKMIFFRYSTGFQPTLFCSIRSAPLDGVSVALPGMNAIPWVCQGSQDGSYLVTAMAGKSEAELWNLTTLKKTVTLKGHTKPITGAAVVGNIAITASQDSTLCTWDVKTGKNLRTLRGHTDEVLSLMVCPDGKRVLSISKDGSARIWDIAAGLSLLSLKENENPVQSVEFSTDGSVILVHGEVSTSLWSLPVTEK